MGLPPKSYFHLTEVAERWDASVSDLACYALDGLLEVSVMAIGLRVEVGWFEVTDNNVSRIADCEKVLNGPQPVIACDLWPAFRGGLAHLGRLKPSSADSYCVLASDVSPIVVALQDLLITRVERDRFEQKHGLGQTEAALSIANEAPAPFIERNNYSDVVLNGEVFKLGLLQAAIVRELHLASTTDSPWRLGKTLLANANAQTMRMVDLFKTKPNWRSLIASDGRGNYRLNLPDQAAPRASHRAYRRLGFALAG